MQLTTYKSVGMSGSKYRWGPAPSDGSDFIAITDAITLHYGVALFMAVTNECVPTIPTQLQWKKLTFNQGLLHQTTIVLQSNQKHATIQSKTEESLCSGLDLRTLFKGISYLIPEVRDTSKRGLQ